MTDSKNSGSWRNGDQSDAACLIGASAKRSPDYLDLGAFERSSRSVGDKCDNDRSLSLLELLRRSNARIESSDNCERDHRALQCCQYRKTTLPDSHMRRDLGTRSRVLFNSRPGTGYLQQGRGCAPAKGKAGTDF